MALLHSARGRWDQLSAPGLQVGHALHGRNHPFTWDATASAISLACSDPKGLASAGPNSTGLPATSSGSSIERLLAYTSRLGS